MSYTDNFLSKQTPKTNKQNSPTVSSRQSVCITHLRKEVFYLTTHSTHLVTVIWRRTYYGEDQSDSERENPLPPHRLFFPILLYAPARVLLYAPSFRQDSTYHGLCYTSRGALAGTRNSSMGPPHEGLIRRPIEP